MTEKKNKFQDIADDIVELVSRKDEAYGSAFESSGKILKILFPNGVQPAQYDNLLAMVRVIDKMCRISNQEGSDPMGEDPWMDIFGYSLLAVFINKIRKNGEINE